MRDVLVSVIVPIYNCQDYLRECLDSVLAQTYKNIEVILVDDGSLDASAEICDEYVNRDCRFRKFYKTNGGLSSARNFGLDNASGDYVIFLDSDDYWCDSTCIEKLVDAALLDKADIVRGELREVDEFGTSISGYKIPRSRIDNSHRILDSGGFLECIMCRDFFVVLSLYKRQILSNIRFNEAHRFQEDIEFHIRLFANSYRCIYIPLCFYAYRRRAGSLTTEINVSKLKFSFLLADVYDKYSQIVSDSRVSNIYKEKSVMMYYWTLGTLSEDPYYQHRKSIINKLNLRELQLKTKARMFNNHIWNKAILAVSVAPLAGVFLMRIKNYITSFLYNLISKYSDASNKL